MDRLKLYLQQYVLCRPATSWASNTGSRRGNFAGSDTSSECHHTVFPAASSMGHYSEVRGLSGVRRSASPFTSKTHLRSAAYHLIDWEISLQARAIATFRDNHTADAENRRARRPVSSSGPTCHICNRVCASDFGLRSQLRSHAHQTSASTASSS